MGAAVLERRDEILCVGFEEWLSISALPCSVYRRFLSRWRSFRVNGNPLLSTLLWSARDDRWQNDPFVDVEGGY
jgi:hypothetical protein